MFSLRSAKRIAAAVRDWEGDIRRRSGAGLGELKLRPGLPMHVRVTGVENDYLTVKRVHPETNAMVGDAFKAAKPRELRHDKKHYDGITTLTTTDAQTVEVGDGTDTETWIVKPPYIPDPADEGYEATELLVLIVAAGMGATFEDGDPAEDVPIHAVDLNIAGRVWGLST